MRRIRSDDVIGQKARRQHVYETVELEFEPKHNSQEQDTSITPTIEEPPADSYKVCVCAIVAVLTFTPLRLVCVPPFLLAYFFVLVLNIL